jgi:DNA repair exonuclease SbcCD ATPase subunit
MRTLKLHKIMLKNFKGIKDLVLNFGDYTNIKGDNGTGKTTIFDSFIWVLFDKDSTDRQSFEIKTLTSNNEAIHGLEHEVSAQIFVDGSILTLTKMFKEKWTKKKGEAQRQLTGHETLYYIDEIPVKQGEYKAKVNSLIDENIFRLITNPTYFSTKMKWQDRRKVLIDIIGDISSEAVLMCNEKLNKLADQLLNRQVEDIKKSIAATKRKLNEEIKSIPYRINELNNSIVKIEEENLEVRKRSIAASITSIEHKLMEGAELQEEVLKEKHRLYNLKTQLKEREYTLQIEAEKPLKKLKEQLRAIENEIWPLENEISKYTYTVQTKEAEIKVLEEQMTKLRLQFKEINKEPFVIPENESVCPYCKRAFQEADISLKIEELQENFNKDKANRKAKINKEGTLKDDKAKSLRLEVKATCELLEGCKLKLQEKKKLTIDINESLSDINPGISLQEDAEYEKLLKDIATLEGKFQENKASDYEITELKNKNELTELKNKKKQLSEDLELVNKQMSTKEHNQRAKARIQELTEEERTLAQHIADLEQQEFLCDEFIKTKVELLESSINNKFKFVTFKLFKTLVNGAVEECCEALINGVPFSDANKASQINAGLDIINALSKHYDVQAPIFIDNRESINEILGCSSQIINLIVSKDKELVVENIKEASTIIDGPDF